MKIILEKVDMVGQGHGPKDIKKCSMQLPKLCKQVCLRYYDNLQLRLIKPLRVLGTFIDVKVPF